MKRIKSTTEDEKILTDQNADLVERSSSAKKLLSDGYGEVVVPVLEQWLNHKEASLRDDAVSLLLASLGHEKYVGKAIEMLHNDPDDIVRGDAARGLALFCAEFIEGEKHEEQIVKELLLALLQEEDLFIQRDCYKGLCRIIKNEDWKYYDEKDYFDRNQDVDWRMLQPYLEEYNLQKSE